MKNLTLSFIFVLVGFSSSLYPNSINLSSEGYLYEQDSLSHSRFYQGLSTSFDLLDKNERSIKFNSYGKWTTDFSNKKTTDPKLNIFDAYFDFDNLLKYLRVKIGRHFVYNGSGSSLIDGITILHDGSKTGSNFFERGELDFFIGSKVDRLRPDKIQSIYDYYVLGMGLTYRLNRSKINLNIYMDTDDEEINKMRGGIDFDHKFSRHLKLFSRIGIDNNSLDQIKLRVNYRKNALYFSTEYQNCKPDVSEASVFYIIDSKRKNRFRNNFRYRLSRNYSVFINSYYSIYEDKDAFSGSVGFASNFYSIAYNFYTGRTENQGLTLSLYHTLQNNLSFYGTANINKYKIQKEIDDSIDAYAVSVGVQKRFKNNYQMKIEYQHLSNANEDSSSRLYLRINKGFNF